MPNAYCPMPALSDPIARADSYHHLYHYQSSAFHLWLGEILCVLEKWEEAHAAFDQAVFQDHRNAFALYGRGWLSHRSGNSIMAWKDYTLAVAMQPTLPPFDQRPDWPAHLSAYDRHEMHATSFCPESGKENSLEADRFCTYAHESFQRQEYAMAAEKLKQAIAFCARAHDAYHQYASQLHFERAEQFESAGEWDLAIADYSKALDLWQDNPQALRARARLHAARGNRTEAEQDRLRLKSSQPTE